MTWEAHFWAPGTELHRRAGGYCEPHRVTASGERYQIGLPWVNAGPPYGPSRQMMPDEREQFHRAQDCPFN